MQQRFSITFLIILLATLRVASQGNADVLNYIETYKEIAINEMKRTGVPASIKIAQGIHETMAGKGDLVKRSNNHFGIKCKSNWEGEKVYHDDDARGECFRSYGRAEDSYMDHSDFLKNNQRYAFLFQLDPTDYEGWAYGLKKAGYATNIRYSQILIKLIRDYNLQEYSLIALGRKSPASEVLVANTVGNEQVIAAPGAYKSSEKNYPQGIFTINDTRVVFVQANTAWLALAQKYELPLHRLLDFNDIEQEEDLLKKDQLVFLERKPKTGNAATCVVKPGESIYDICQAQGIRYASLLALNHLEEHMLPAEGEIIYLQAKAASRPMLAAEKSIVASHNTPKVNNRYGTHVVSNKETLYSISKKYGVEMEKIVGWNKLDTMNLKVGQQLIIYKP
jgi:LysM repeat protein